MRDEVFPGHFTSCIRSRELFSFSGGERQRFVVARALALHAELLVADEPTSGLDVSVQAQVLNLLRQLKREMGLTLLFISHDLGAVRYVAQRIAVMYLGRVVETGTVSSIFSAPRHPYTQALLRSVPRLDGRQPDEGIQGDLPSPTDLPKGCRFAVRCPFAADRCRVEDPALEPDGQGGMVACHFHQDIAAGTLVWR